MKTLSNPQDRDEILKRLANLTPASQRKWGKMSAPQAICHLSDAFNTAMGGKQPASVSTWFSRTGMKWIALWSNMTWPHGIKTVPECEAGRGGTPPAQFEDDLRRLRDHIARFTHNPRDFEIRQHPIFGNMSEKDWMRWGYLHMDHHLRQFGA